MFDGCMIYGIHYENNDLINTIIENVNKTFEGLNMKWTYKAHDNSIKIPESWKPDLLAIGGKINKKTAPKKHQKKLKRHLI